MQRANKLILYGIILAVSGLYIYRNRLVFADILFVVLFSVFISAILSPVCSAAERRGIPPSAASGLSLILLTGSFLFFVSALVPYLVRQGTDLIQRSIPILFSVINSLSKMVGSLGFSPFERSDIPAILANVLGKLSAGLTAFGLSVASKTGLLFFSFAIVYYILKERKILCQHLLLFVPSAWRGIFLSALQNCTDSIKSYFGAICKTSLIVACMTYLSLFILKVPNAFLLALFMGLLEMLPYVGPVIASVPILLSSLSLGIHAAATVLLLLILIQQIEGNLISPYFTSSSTSLHPLTALFSVFLFGRLFGFSGVLFAVPAVMIGRCLFWLGKQICNLTKAQEKIETL